MWLGKDQIEDKVANNGGGFLRLPITNQDIGLILRKETEGRKCHSTDRITIPFWILNGNPLPGWLWLAIISAPLSYSSGYCCFVNPVIGGWSAIDELIILTGHGIWQDFTS